MFSLQKISVRRSCCIEGIVIVSLLLVVNHAEFVVHLNFLFVYFFFNLFIDTRTNLLVNIAIFSVRKPYQIVIK